MPPYITYASPFDNAPEPAPITAETIREVAEGLAAIGYTFDGDGITYLGITVEQLQQLANRREEELKPKPAKVYARSVPSTGEVCIYVGHPTDADNVICLYVGADYPEGYEVVERHDASADSFGGELVFGCKR